MCVEQLDQATSCQPTWDATAQDLCQFSPLVLVQPCVIIFSVIDDEYRVLFIVPSNSSSSSSEVLGGALQKNSSMRSDKATRSRAISA